MFAPLFEKRPLLTLSNLPDGVVRRFPDPADYLPNPALICYFVHD
jgi:hypothetical protein